MKLPSLPLAFRRGVLHGSLAVGSIAVALSSGRLAGAPAAEPGEVITVSDGSILRLRNVRLAADAGGWKVVGEVDARSGPCWLIPFPAAIECVVTDARGAVDRVMIPVPWRRLQRGRTEPGQAPFTLRLPGGKQPIQAVQLRIVPDAVRP